MHSFRQTTFPTSLGYSISTWQIGDSSASILAILLPGFLDTKDYHHLKKLGERLAQSGYLAVSFDPLGVWQSNAPIELYTMTNWLKEIEELVFSLRDQYPSVQQVLFIGHSMGGMLSLLYASSHSISLAVSIMGPASFVREETYQKRIVEWKSEKIKTSYREHANGGTEKISIQLPFSFVEDSLQYDVLSVSNSIHCPLLLIGGDSDILVSEKSIRQLSQHFPRNQVSVEIINNTTHDYRKNPTSIDQVNNCILQFLKAKL